LADRIASVIDFRYHLVSIVAVFLALALGLFLGSTTLQGRVFDDLKGRTDKVTKQRDLLSSQLAAANDRIKQQQNFDKALLPYAVSGRLSGQLVTVVSAPGTSDSLRKQVLSTIDAAGATVSADVRLQNAIVDPTQDAFLTALTERVSVPGRADAAPESTGGERAAAQLAAVLGVRPSAHGVPPSTVDTVLSAYSTGKLLVVADKDGVARPGTLAVVLTGPPPAASADQSAVRAQQDFVLALLRDLDRTSLGAVLAVPTPPDGASSDMTTAVANDPDVSHQASTVTGADTAAGAIATVFALAAQADGVAGRYGIGSQVQPLPTASGAP
jgi:hypothetical protein